MNSLHTIHESPTGVSSSSDTFNESRDLLCAQDLLSTHTDLMMMSHRRRKVSKAGYLLYKVSK